MKVLLVSFFNELAYGVRVLHSNLIENSIEAYMLFFKRNDLLGNSHNENVKNDFVGERAGVSSKEIEILISHIKENKYDVIGFSLVSQHFYLYKKIYEKIKKIDDLTVVVGGWHASLDPDTCINYADFLCIGEGESPLVDLVCRLSKKEKTANIENFHIKTASGVIKNSVRPLPKDISAFPIPLFEHEYSYVIENDEIVNYEPYFNSRRYSTFIGRGCPFRCTYCSNSFMAESVYPGRWSIARHRSIEHMKRELLTVKKQLKLVEAINFYDEVFAPKTEWIKEFFSWYKTEISIPFFVLIFPGSLNDEKAKILADGGLDGVWMGIQSGSERVRNEIFKRKYSNDRILKQARIFHKYGVSVRYDFILDNPFETFEESLESIYLMLKLPQPFSLNLFSLKYFPNTEITKMAEAAGFITEADKDGNQEKDRDSYHIHKDKGDLDSKFINYLAFYIDSLSGTQSLEDKRNDLYKLINDYKHSKDISYVENLAKPFFS